MQNKNARQRVQDAYTQLQTCKDNLNQAVNSVEKQQNKVQIQSTIAAIDNAITTANRTLSNYQE
ncbi:hypothetical protein [Sporosalibacterium faouarense]|uniref:hypothetical protein n=1 Tax=Sporosalibacterium faouarense TaxID=516123 RepID=UPI00141C3249|nr:hypothetical protein [Sporosalibacterium faouarense]MTI49155.1 hypothetical protein [Bacillota bacterium]